jgi:hypothetical protein
LCDCIARINEGIKDDGWQLSTCRILKPGDVKTFARITLEKINNPKKTMSTLPDFCPFCGERYVK